MNTIAKIFLISVAVLGVSLPAAAQQRRTIWSGIYSEEQAVRGETAFVSICARCHLQNLSGKNGPSLKSDRFIEDFRETSLRILFSTVRSMPPDSVRSVTAPLTDANYLDIMTYILKVNGAPAGPKELTAAEVPGIQFEKKTGPEPLPSLTLVTLVGCLAETQSAWMLAEGSTPMRTMNGDILSPEELQAAKTVPLGTNFFPLSQVDYIDSPIEDHADQKVALKGTLIHQDQGSRINLTALETIGGSCR